MEICKECNASTGMRCPKHPELKWEDEEFKFYPIDTDFGYPKREDK